MRRPKTRGLVFAYEGSPAYIRSVREEADVWSWERETHPLSQLGHSRPPEKVLSTERGPGDLKLVVQEVPLVLEAKLEKPHSEHPRQRQEESGMTGGLVDDARVTLEETGSTRTPLSGV